MDDFDFQSWRSQYGKNTGWIPADGNGDGVVDTADYIFWRQHQSGGSGTGSAAVIPEPACTALVVSGVLMGLSYTRRRPRQAQRTLR